ncbi:hypothetical protein HNV12_16700 [Methanococcoides sp. SA1]|nr:hypothetical protein [Methanococcoides sp. SA1]
MRICRKMLDCLGASDKSAAIFKATEEVIGEGKSLTGNMGGEAFLNGMTDTIIAKL